MEKKNLNFKLLRMKAALTQKEVEVKSGIYASKISYFENYQATPTPEEIVKLASVLGCTKKDLESCFNEEIKNSYGHKRALK